MKKLLYLFCTSFFVLISCSSGDDDNNSSSTNLVKKIIYSADGQIYGTRTFTYEGNKIVSEIEISGIKINYTYAGDLITKIEELDQKGIVLVKTEYTYTAGKLSTSLRKSSVLDSYGEKKVYTYNSDGSVSCDNFLLDGETGALVSHSLTEEKYYFSAGNLVKIFTKQYGTEAQEITYEYDSKNNPFKNVTGYALLLDHLEDEEVSTNNATKIIYYFDTAITNIYTYNANGLPTEQKRFNNGDASRVTQYIY